MHKVILLVISFILLNSSGKKCIKEKRRNASNVYADWNFIVWKLICGVSIDSTA